MSVNNRIQEIVDHLYSGNKRAFSQAVGVSPAVIENIVGKRQSNPSYEVTYKILSSIDNISAEWLMKGEGKMTQEKKIHEVIATRPRIPLHASAGALTMAESGVMLDQCEQLPVIENLPKYDFTIRVRGNSMVPEFHGGDEVACLFIREFSFIQWGRIHVLDTAQGIVMKMLDDAGEYFICRSANPDYKEFKIHKSEVFNIALVVGLVRTY